MGEPITPEPTQDPPPEAQSSNGQTLAVPFAVTSLTEVAPSDLVGHTIRFEAVQYTHR